jgi:hypothetical protein
MLAVGIFSGVDAPCAAQQRKNASPNTPYGRPLTSGVTPGVFCPIFPAMPQQLVHDDPSGTALSDETTIIASSLDLRRRNNEPGRVERTTEYLESASYVRGQPVIR